MQIKTILLPLAITAILLGCSKEQPTLPNEPIHHENSNLEVWVRTQSDTGLVNAAGAVIALYESDLYRADNHRPLEGATGADGKHTFISLAKDQYWISVRYDGEVKWIFEDAPYDTPGHPVLLNKLEVVFED